MSFTVLHFFFTSPLHLGPEVQPAEEHLAADQLRDPPQDALGARRRAFAPGARAPPLPQLAEA